jgi:hypothetical protein
VAVFVGGVFPVNAWLLVGVVTWYAGGFVGQPLYCSEPGARWRYDEATPAWVALDVGEFESGHARCGDRIVIVGDGWSLEAVALDAGPLYDWSVEGKRIVADVPLHLWPLAGMSGRATVVNRSALNRWRLGEADRFRLLDLEEGSDE